jgi:hypothetical protein
MVSGQWFGKTACRGCYEEHNEGGIMNIKLLSYAQTVFIIPLWLGLITDFIKERPLLRYFTIGFSTLLMLVNAVLLFRELLIIYDTWYNFHCRRMDALVRRTRKKLKKTIAWTNNVSIMDYAIEKLGEISLPATYSGIINELVKKERNPAKQKTLLSYISS